jgi:hypothetical protein
MSYIVSLDALVIINFPYAFDIMGLNFLAKLMLLLLATKL